MTALRVSGCTVAFGGLRAVDDLTLAFPGDRISGLIGPNGSGKSTFVNMVSGQIPPLSGSIRLDDEPICSLRPDQIVKRGLARTYQVPKAPRELTIAEVLSVPLRYVRPRRSLPAELRTAATLAAFCGLNPPVDTPCARLSVPDLRRLEIARALACGPRVLLLDEAMTGLSVEDTEQVVDLVRQIHQIGVSIILIEHVMRIIASLCRYTVVLNNGSVLASGEPRSVLGDERVREAYLGRGFRL